MRPDVNGRHLRHHPNVPELDDAICVTTGNEFALEIKDNRVAAVEVAVKCLRAEPGSGIPQGHSLVAAAGAQIVRERLPAHRVHAVHVSSQSGAALCRGKIPEPGGVVETATGEKVAGVVESHAPDGLGVLSESQRAPGGEGREGENSGRNERVCQTGARRMIMGQWRRLGGEGRQGVAVEVGWVGILTLPP